jgi:hypothetical protein
MKRSRLSRHARSVKKVRLKSGSDVNVLREGFREGMMRSSNVHLIEYSKLSDDIAHKDVFLTVMREEAKREIDRRNMLLEKWGKERPFFTPVERLESTIVEKGYPIYKAYKAQEHFADVPVQKVLSVFRQRTGIDITAEPYSKVLEREARKRGWFQKF